MSAGLEAKDGMDPTVAEVPDALPARATTGGKKPSTAEKSGNEDAEKMPLVSAQTAPANEVAEAHA